jgi:hypothetical protein
MPENLTHATSYNLQDQYIQKDLYRVLHLYHNQVETGNVDQIMPVILSVT